MYVCTYLKNSNGVLARNDPRNTVATAINKRMTELGSKTTAGGR